MPVFDTFAAMESYIKNELKDALNGEIADMVDQTIKEHAVSDVYNAYDQVAYIRRNYLSSGNYYRHEVSGLTLIVTDETPGNDPIASGHKPTGTELSEIIETGAQNNGFGKWLGAFPRPYMSNAQEEVIPKAVDILQAKFK